MKHMDLDDLTDYDILSDESNKEGKVKSILSKLKSPFKPKPKPMESLPAAPEPITPKKNITDLAIEQAIKKLDKEKAFTKPLPPAPSTLTAPNLSDVDDVVHVEITPHALLPEYQTPVPKPSFFSRIFKRKPKQEIPQEVKQQTKYRTVDASIQMFAFLIGTVGVMLVYHEIPTHPYMIIGIIGIAVSAGIITGINRW